MRKQRWYSNVPVSRPVVQTDEVAGFNGLAWSDRLGIVVGRGEPGKAALDELRKLRRGRA